MQIGVGSARGKKRKHKRSTMRWEEPKSKIDCPRSIVRVRSCIIAIQFFKRRPALKRRPCYTHRRRWSSRPIPSRCAIRFHERVLLLAEACSGNTHKTHRQLWVGWDTRALAAVVFIQTSAAENGNTRRCNDIVLLSSAQDLVQTVTPLRVSS